MKWFNLSDNVNLLALLGALATLLLTFFVVRIYMNKMKEKANKEVLGDTWDGIGEQDNDLPMGWAVMFVLLIGWAIWYFLFGYPLNSYSQIGEYNDAVKAHNAKFEAKYANLDQETLISMGEGIFLVQCSQCHGVSGDGINGKAQDLRKWGNEEALIDVIKVGSKGLNYPLGEMTAMGGGLLTDADQVKAVAAFVAQDISNIKSTKHPELVEQGREIFATTCASCHDEAGKGLEGSSPDLTKYGSSDFVVDVLNRGKHGYIGQMPQFIDGRLNDIQKRAVGEYVISLSKR